MKTIRYFLFFFVMTLSSSGADVTDTPGGIRLLPGYYHQALQSYDTEVGIIWKERGLSIHNDIGQLAGNFATAPKPDRRFWSKDFQRTSIPAHCDERSNAPCDLR